MNIKIRPKELYRIDSKKAVALFSCLYVLVSLNSVPLRIIPSIICAILSLLFSIIALAIAYKTNSIVITKYRLGLFFLLFVLTFYFYAPCLGHPLNIGNLIVFSGILPLLFFEQKIYYLLFRYVRKIIVFVSICSLIIFVLLFLFPQNTIPFPSFEMNPISMTHIKHGVSYKIYAFVVTYIGYDNVIFSTLGVSRICGFMSEPGHWGVFIAFILIAELFLYNKRSWILILCGLCTFSTAFYLILAIMELYLIFITKSFQWKRYLLILLSVVLLLLIIGPELRQSLWDMAIGRNIDVDKSLDDRTSPMGMLVWNHFLNKDNTLIKLFGFSPFSMELKGIIVVDYREIIYDCGFVGTVLVIFVLLYNLAKVNLKHLILLLSVVGLIFIHRVWMFYMPYMYAFIIIISFACNYYNCENQESLYPHD